MIRVIMIGLLCGTLWGDIDAQIEAIQNASIEERFKLMNAFKKEIIKMREQERLQAIHQLKALTKNPHTKKGMNEIKIQESHTSEIEKQIEEEREQAMGEHEVENISEHAIEDEKGEKDDD